jgi:uncharacterized protein
MPEGIGVVDLMIGFPHRDRRAVYDYLREGAKDKETKEDMSFLAEYMFKDVPDEVEEERDPVEVTITEMDRFGIDIGLVGLSSMTLDARERHPGRFLLSLEVNPNDVMESVRAIHRAKEERDLAAVTFFPAGCLPQVPVDDPKAYAVYAMCVELDIPVIVNAGIAGPRFPSACQHVELFDQVCFDFPELRIVMRHGAEPWEELAVKLMLKWPGLYYMPSAFAPKYYPKAIIDYANTRGADKIMYAGYYPMGLTLERIFAELPGVPFRAHVWPKFLRENAMEVFKIDEHLKAEVR